MVAAATVVALLALASFLIGLAQEPRGRPDAGADPSPTVQSPAPARSGPVVDPPQGGVNLRIRVVSGSTWIKVTNASGKELFQGLLAAGVVKEFSDPKVLTVRYGNSRAVNVAVNGKDLGAPACGAVVCTERYQLDATTG